VVSHCPISQPVGGHLGFRSILFFKGSHVSRLWTLLPFFFAVEMCHPHLATTLLKRILHLISPPYSIAWLLALRRVLPDSDLALHSILLIITVAPSEPIADYIACSASPDPGGFPVRIRVMPTFFSLETFLKKQSPPIFSPCQFPPPARDFFDFLSSPRSLRQTSLLYPGMLMMGL